MFFSSRPTALRFVRPGTLIPLLFTLLHATASLGQTDREQALLQALAERQAEVRAARAAYETRFGPIRPLHLADGTRLFPTTFVEGRPVYHISLGHISLGHGPLGPYAGQAVSANDLWPGGAMALNLTGSNILLGIWESGGYALPTHAEFDDGGGSRVTLKGTMSVDADVTSHATQVTGIASAAGADPTLKGVAYEALIHAYDDTLDAVEMASAVLNDGLQVSNHAYGSINGWGPQIRPDDITLLPSWWGDPAVDTQEDYQFGFYNTESALWDDIAHTFDGYLIVISAGNDRSTDASGVTDHWVYTDTGPHDGWEISTAPRFNDGYDNGGFDTIIGGPQAAKNVLTVGMVENIDNPLCGTDPAFPPLAMTHQSAWGPVDDGRIKPDLVAPGKSIHMPTPNGGTCGGQGGTSFSAPVVTGVVGLLLDYQNQLFQAGLSPYPALRAATMKALLLHTAQDFGTTGPDYFFGWGMADAGEAAAVMQRNAAEGGAVHLFEETLASSQTYTLDVFSDGSEPLRVTIAWNDPEGLPVSHPSRGIAKPNWIDRSDIRLLVNDLDLRVVHPNGATTYRPWTLNVAQPANAAVRTQDNNRDNVEQVLVDTPVAGIYRITVTHKGSLSGGPQDFSLVATGNAACGTTWSLSPGWHLLSIPCTASDLSTATLFPGAEAVYGFDGGGYTSPATVTPNAGYWVKVTSAQSYLMAGSRATPTVIDVHDGWNMIGPFGAPLPIAALQPSGSMTLLSDFFKFDGGGYEAEPTTLQPGVGYWIKVSEAGTLTVDE